MRNNKDLLKAQRLAILILVLVPMTVIGQNIEAQTVERATEEKSIMDDFFNRNPLAVEMKILNEGTKAYLCADDENLFVRLSVSNPMLFMRMLMQGFTISIDPTCRRKRSYSAVFPSATDVEQQMNIKQQTIPEEVGDRPDIGPIIMAMNKLGAIFKIKGKAGAPDASRSYVELDSENEILNFCALFPKAEMLEEKKLVETWQLGIYVEHPSVDMEPPIAYDKDNLGAYSPQNKARGQNIDMKEDNSIARAKINFWIKFSIDEIDNINLK